MSSDWPLPHRGPSTLDRPVSRLRRVDPRSNEPMATLAKAVFRGKLGRHCGFPRKTNTKMLVRATLGILLTAIKYRFGQTAAS